ncbi:MAG: enoyl-CoA hydratase/isomerase family protein [Micrococcales bacterium]|nr:enoyl-CoA hydratase/isomerase family protein [Micrococcales bacterium]
MSDLVTLSTDAGLAHIELNRPDAANAFDLPTAQRLLEVVRQVRDDDAVRAILVTGAGKRYCAGGDVASMASSDSPGAYLQELADVLDGALQELAATPKPVVTAVQGAVAGAGLAVMLSCDVIVAAESTKFVTAYAGTGLTPDCGLSYLLPRAVGSVRAMDLVLTGRALTAAEALEWGLVTQVAPDAEATDAARELATRLAAGPAEALGHAKRLGRLAWSASRAEIGADEGRTIAVMVETEFASKAVHWFAR